MSSPRLNCGLITLCLLLSCRIVEAQANYTGPGPATFGSPNTTGPGATPALIALPATGANAPSGLGGFLQRKFYTITADLRETYDDNANTTTNGNKTSALETTLSPSVLVDFPIGDSDFTARYTFNLTYYSAGGNGNSSNDPSVQYTHEFDAQYAHTFSERFSLSLGDDFRYYTEPNIFQSTGTNYNNGPYASNIFNGSFSSQWTPLVGSTTTYSNTVVNYENSAIAQTQNSDENTGSQSVSFAILPKISVSVGGIFDQIDYSQNDRGYTSYTGFGGAQWQALPTLSVSGRLGASYTEQAQTQQSAQLSPYGDLSINWTLGARSSLAFDYSHEVTPTDQPNENAQNSDRFSSSFTYAITPRLSSHLDGTFTIADTSQDLAVSGAPNSSAHTEYDYGLDTGLTFQYNNYLNFEGGVTVTGVSSDITGDAYNRDQVYLGVRGTY